MRLVLSLIIAAVLTGTAGSFSWSHKLHFDPASIIKPAILSIDSGNFGSSQEDITATKKEKNSIVLPDKKIHLTPHPQATERKLLTSSYYSYYYYSSVPTTDDFFSVLTKSPTTVPSAAPFPTTDSPTLAPVNSPTVIPTSIPTWAPTTQPTEPPTTNSYYYYNPSVTDDFFAGGPTTIPTAIPTAMPTWAPTAVPSVTDDFFTDDVISATPTASPTPTSGSPTLAPVNSATAIPTTVPTATSTWAPTTQTTEPPTTNSYYYYYNPSVTDDFFAGGPTTIPTTIPTAMPTWAPTAVSSAVPTPTPGSPTLVPTATPTTIPTAMPTWAPTTIPTTIPTAMPTWAPTAVPSAVPTPTPGSPTLVPTATPTTIPTAMPTWAPTAVPSAVPTPTPTLVPTATPTTIPTAMPTWAPTAVPSAVPTPTPTLVPTATPTTMPSWTLTATPTALPTTTPSAVPIAEPSEAPTTTPSAVPSVRPTPIPGSPTLTPTTTPTAQPSTGFPTVVPTRAPSVRPSKYPTPIPSALPTPIPGDPTVAPTATPTFAPTESNLVIMEASQTIKGTSIEQYNEDRANYTIIFRNSIADCMDNVTVDEVVNLVVAAANRRKLFLRGNDVNEAVAQYTVQYASSPSSNRMLQSSEAIELTYEVKTNQPGVSYESLSTQLADNVASGVFDEQLSVYAEIYDAPALKNATSEAVNTTNVPIPESFPSSSSDDNTLGAGIIAGIVLVCFLACAIVCVMVFDKKLTTYCFPYSDEELQNVAPETADRKSRSPIGGRSSTIFLNNPINPHAASNRRRATSEEVQPSQNIEMSDIRKRVSEEGSDGRPRPSVSNPAQGSSSQKQSALQRMSVMFTGSSDRNAEDPGTGRRSSSRKTVSPSSNRGSVASPSAKESIGGRDSENSARRPTSQVSDSVRESASPKMTSRRGSSMMVSANPLMDGRPSSRPSSRPSTPGGDSSPRKSVFDAARTPPSDSPIAAQRGSVFRFLGSSDNVTPASSGSTDSPGGSARRPTSRGSTSPRDPTRESTLSPGSVKRATVGGTGGAIDARRPSSRSPASPRKGSTVAGGTQRSDVDQPAAQPVAPRQSMFQRLSIFGGSGSNTPALAGREGQDDEEAAGSTSPRRSSTIRRSTVRPSSAGSQPSESPLPRPSSRPSTSGNPRQRPSSPAVPAVGFRKLSISDTRRRSRPNTPSDKKKDGPPDKEGML